MKRFAVSSLATLCGLVLATTAHASFIEKSFRDDPEWKTQEDVDSETESENARANVRQATQERTEEEETETTHNDASTKEMPRMRIQYKTQDEIRSERMANVEALNLNGAATITRAEFTAMLVRSRYSQSSINLCYWDITSVWPPRFELLFRDVPVDHEFAPEICVAMRDGLVRGYGNDIFRPDAQITFADAAKVIARSSGLTPYADPSTPEHWFDTYVHALAQRNAIPMSIEKLEERITADEAQEIIRRLIADDRDDTSRTAEELIITWERTYEPPRRVVITTPQSSSPTPSSAGSQSSVKSAASTTSNGTITSTPATNGSASSRPKAWYEF